MQQRECPHCGLVHEDVSHAQLMFGCTGDDCPGRHAAIRVAAAGLQVVQQEEGWKWWHTASATYSNLAWGDPQRAFLDADEMVVKTIAECVNINPDRFKTWRIGAQVESIVNRL